jgi:multidrug efflux pump subunit AcrB
MWLVKLGLRRPYTLAVVAILLAVLGGLSIQRTPTDVLPDIDIPVVSAIWQYRGLSADEMERRITTASERSFTTTVSDIEHIESQTLNGLAVIKVFFHPGTSVDAAVAQMAAISQTVTRQMPTGTTPPLIIRFNASSIPILQLGLGGEGLSEQALYDIGANFLRTQLATVQGASILQPAGGRARQILVDLDPEALFSRGLAPADVSAAITAQSPILPAGTIKTGERELTVRLNTSPAVVTALNDLPVAQHGANVIYVRDVAQVRDGGAVQTNVVRQDGRRGAQLGVLKTGHASTLDIVARVKQTLPRILSTLPPELDVKLLQDQSLFVRAAIDTVVKEGLLAAVLTSLMILLFLGSWRSTLIVSTSIPLSILASLILLRVFGHTINVMTLGGLALSIGILVDEAVVAVENIHRHLDLRKSMVRAVLDGAGEIAIPALVSALAISIVFVPVFLLTGTARYLFAPLALAVVFAMLASYLLSRTLVPAMVRLLLRGEVLPPDGHVDATRHGQTGALAAFHARFLAGFDRLRDTYRGSLGWALARPWHVLVAAGVFVAASAGLATQLGQDFFPAVDGGQLRLHVRAPAGTRLETTEALFARVEDRIRQVIPPEALDTILDNIGLPVLPLNMAYSDSATIGSADGEIFVSLTPQRRRGDTWEYGRRLRTELPAAFPDLTFFFRSSDMVSQILNFGIPAPIDIQVVGRDLAGNRAVARDIERRLRAVPGAVDVRLHQGPWVPEVLVDVDRTRAGEFGLTERDVASNVLISLSSSGQVAPNYWLHPATGVSYLVAVQTPEYRLDSLDALANTPLATRGRPAQVLGNVATFGRGESPQAISHYDVQPTLDVLASVQDRDLGSVAREVDRIVAQVRPTLPRGSVVQVRGQVQTMRDSFRGLAGGMVLAVLLVYLVMVVNFQSWRDPFIILFALPGALAGIVWALFVTHTTINVPSLMGAIMSLGVATANSILVVTFANQQLALGVTTADAALSAGVTRLRPVLMTALAMIIGMVPMALGLGEGGEQNAPIGRAVIGGLLVATVATLFVVPVVYTTFKGRPRRVTPEPDAELLA